MEIQQTTNYDAFETITGNRNISNAKVEGLMADIENGLDLLPYCPIIVYKNEEKLCIVDGQHRFTVSQTLGRPVYYVEAEEICLQNIAKMNSRQDKWKAMDFIHCYIKVGIEDYQVLLDIIQKYHVGVSVASGLLMTGKINDNGSLGTGEAFRSGNFKVLFLDETTRLLDLNHKLFDRYRFYTDRKLISATYQLIKKGLCNFDILLEKIDKHPVLMDKQVSSKDYIFNIERIYNHNNVKRHVIF